jgi:hypothetical protein
LTGSHNHQANMTSLPAARVVSAERSAANGTTRHALTRPVGSQSGVNLFPTTEAGNPALPENGGDDGGTRMGTRARKRRNELVTASYAYVRCHGVIDARQCEGRAILLPLAVFNTRQEANQQSGEAMRRDVFTLPLYVASSACLSCVARAACVQPTPTTLLDRSYRFVPNKPDGVSAARFNRHDHRVRMHPSPLHSSFP